MNPLTNAENSSPLAFLKPQVLTNQEVEALLEKPTKISLSGDIFQKMNVSYKELTLDELQQEKIDISKFTLTTQTSTKNPTDDRILVAFRNPEDPDTLLLYKLDKNLIEDLKKNFDKENFFQREDGILRLNGKVEEYLAGWTMDIKLNRGYSKADINNNGKIDDAEKGELKIGYETNGNYRFIQENITSISIKAGGKKYQSYKNTHNFNNFSNIQSTQSLKFTNSVEQALAQTLRLDSNKDGTLSLEENLEDFRYGELDLAHFIKKRYDESHQKWLRDLNMPLQKNTLYTKDFQNKIVDHEKSLKEFQMLETTTKDTQEALLIQLQAQKSYEHMLKLLPEKKREDFLFT